MILVPAGYSPDPKPKPLPEKKKVSKINDRWDFNKIYDNRSYQSKIMEKSRPAKSYSPCQKKSEKLANLNSFELQSQETSPTDLFRKISGTLDLKVLDRILIGSESSSKASLPENSETNQNSPKNKPKCEEYHPLGQDLNRFKRNFNKVFQPKDKNVSAASINPKEGRPLCFMDLTKSLELALKESESAHPGLTLPKMEGGLRPRQILHNNDRTEEKLRGDKGKHGPADENNGQKSLLYIKNGRTVTKTKMSNETSFEVKKLYSKRDSSDEVRSNKGNTKEQKPIRSNEKPQVKEPVNLKKITREKIFIKNIISQVFDTGKEAKKTRENSYDLSQVIESLNKKNDQFVKDKIEMGKCGEHLPKRVYSMPNAEKLKLGTSAFLKGYKDESFEIEGKKNLEKSNSRNSQLSCEKVNYQSGPSYDDYKKMNLVNRRTSKGNGLFNSRCNIHESQEISPSITKSIDESFDWIQEVTKFQKAIKLDQAYMRAQGQQAIKDRSLKNRFERKNSNNGFQSLDSSNKTFEGHRQIGENHSYMKSDKEQLKAFLPNNNFSKSHFMTENKEKTTGSIPYLQKEKSVGIDRKYSVLKETASASLKTQYSSTLSKVLKKKLDESYEVLQHLKNNNNKKISQGLDYNMLVKHVDNYKMKFSSK